MKYVIIIFALLYSKSSNSQESLNSCFKEEIISVYKSTYSKNGSLEGIDGLGVEFYIADNREKVVLKSKYLKHFKTDLNNISEYKNRFIDTLVSQYRIALLENYTDSTIVIPTIYKGVALIQEALDEDNNWRPIEINSDYVSCYVGTFDEIEIKSKEFIELYVKKYCGNFYTKLRIKLRTANRIIYSEIYNGYINKDLFDLKPLIKKSPKQFNFIDMTFLEEYNRQKKLVKFKK